MGRQPNPAINRGIKAIAWPRSGRYIPVKAGEALKSAVGPITRAVCGGSKVTSGGPAPEFAKLLRQLRASAGLTQEELAETRGPSTARGRLRRRGSTHRPGSRSVPQHWP